MAIEYRLVLAGSVPVERVAECAISDIGDRSTPMEVSPLLSVDLSEQCGFELIVRPGRNGYYEAEGDDGSTWEWEPGAYVNVTFRMSKEEHIDKGIPNMLTAVKRVLAALPEDAALILNSDVLLLTRIGGVVRKHRRALWWDHYGFVNDLVPG